MTKLARFISILFHPLFILFYLLWILLLVNPYAFNLTDPIDKGFVFISIFMLSIGLPLISIIMMRFVGFVNSLEMSEKSERIGPLIATSIFYLWLFVNLKRVDIIPPIFQSLALGSVIAIFLAFFINNFSKISLHAIGVGGLLSGLIIIRKFWAYDSFKMDLLGKQLNIGIDILLIAVVLACGLVLSSRLYLKAHTREEVYGGFILGFLTQIIALRFIDF